MAKGQAEKTPLKKEKLKAEVYDMLPFRSPHNKILEVKKLPTLPEVAYRLLDLLAGEPEISELEEVIRYDQSLTAKILSVANSAYVNTQKEIHSLERAIVILGVREVSEIAFSICVFSVFKPLKNLTDFDLREFWLHSISTGITARIIAQALDLKNEDKFFTFGLLHDIGRVLLVHLFPERFEEILLNQKESGRSLLAEEMEAGLAHTWTGRWLLKRWGLPEGFALVARFHHHPFYKNHFLFEPAIIKLADMTVHNLNLVNLPGGQRGDPAPLLSKLGLSEDLYQAIIEHLTTVRETITEAWSHVI